MKIVGGLVCHMIKSIVLYLLPVGHRRGKVVLVVVLVVTAHNNGRLRVRSTTKVLPQQTFFGGLFSLIICYIPEDFDQGKLQKSKGSYCQLSF